MGQDAEFPKVTVILRRTPLEAARTIAAQMTKSRIRSMEVSLVTDDALDTIRALNDEFGDELHIGAGTVRTVEEARAAIDAGSSFLLSPVGFSQGIIDVAKDAGVVSVPSGFSPTEIATMFDMGADIVKVFPASRLGPAYLKDLAAPLGPLPLMVVGGINAQNVQDYFDAGASYAGIGSGCFNPDDVATLNGEGIARSLAKLEKNVRW
ncbi:bifunctional 4-hydroxy-2-oxoglutarate aldolase/2-dehydro-3-deoxy-phosphogluconate aldolase [Olsenella sp. KGMB02461]|nr:bifunctional 4-hydroxy-2-oxoglutarate aldolase/2-dehydro-3-deoxy-phosphogluconate aldolase [Olsenella sp. KGMB02461]